MKLKKGNQHGGFLFVLPSLLGVAIFVLLPFADVVRRSFTSVISEEWVGFKNYMTVFDNVAFQLAAKNTLRFVGVCIPLLIVISLSISVFLHRQEKYGDMIKMAFLVPMAIPVASVVLMWKILFHQNGMINGLLDMINVEAIDWMNTKYAFGVLVFSYLWKNVGYNIVLWMAGLSTIPYSIYEAARVDGANEWQCFLKITIPNLWKVFYTITILAVLNSFKVFREAYLVAGEYPNDSMYMLQHLFNNWYRELSIDKLSAAAVLVALIFTIFVIQFQKALDE